MPSRNWLITGVSSGFGRELTTQLLDRGDTVVGTVRRPDIVADLLQKYPGTFLRELLDVTDASAVREVVDRSFTALGRIDVIVSNAGYGPAMACSARLRNYPTSRSATSSPPTSPAPSS
jgi:NAD(P)-dependent dehydrogenase (short-subunit alcohol dehydrogenase family)